MTENNNTEDAELLTAVWQRLHSRYQQFINNCRAETITDGWVKSFLAIARDCLAECQDAQLAPKDINNVAVMTRNFARTIMSQAGWLDDVTRDALRNFIAEQPEFVGEKYKFTADLFSWNIAQWQRDLSPLAHQPNLNFLEVGSFEGQSACWLLDNILTEATSQLTCVDLFVANDADYFSKEGYFALGGADSAGVSLSQRFDANIVRSGAQARVRKIVGNSHEVLRNQPWLHYDFIYIDGSHIARDVLEDAVLAWRLLKVGGLLTFDDYRLQGHADPLQCPGIAIDAFLTVYQGHYRLLHKGYQITLEKNLLGH